ncbi:MAG: mercuric ion binding protein [Parasphingorhabdus sp.]|jgi:mercuric ion binding protein
MRLLMKTSITLLFACLCFSGVVSAEIKTITLDIPKMDCPLCPITVKTALNRVDGVTEVDADLATKSALVSFDDKVTTVQALISATTNAGYPSELKQ